MPDPCIKTEGDGRKVIDLRTGEIIHRAIEAHTGLIASRDFYVYRMRGLFGRLVRKRVYGDFRIIRPT